ncbi:MAG: extracellular solute-binding protein [Chloroflexota bacterium]|nr:extracellular solute-binding protein [Chloroflexota bacterium]
MRLVLFTFAALLTAACGADSPTPASLSTGASSTRSIAAATLLTPTARPADVATAPPNVIVSDRLPLTIWLPEPLAPLDNAEAETERALWIDEFAASAPDIEVTLRIKQPAEVGGILATLRSASLVAPGALPDLTLLRRADLAAAYASGLVQPLDPTAFAVIDDDLHSAVAALGVIDAERVGLPYMVDVLHLALPTEGIADAADPETWRFEAVLLRSTELLIPIGRATPLNEVFLAQYRAAADADLEALPLSAAALERVLAFYETAARDGILPSDSAGLTAPTDYLDRITGETAGVVTSGLYLALVAGDYGAPRLRYAPLPTEDGTLTTVIDGWMWAITTADAGRQAACIRWLNWLFEVERHSRYASAVGLLPTGRSTLRQHTDGDYALFIDALLENATLPLDDSVGGAAARAMQSALLSVIAGESSAVQAANDVVGAAPIG